MQVQISHKWQNLSDFHGWLHLFLFWLEFSLLAEVSHDEAKCSCRFILPRRERPLLAGKLEFYGT